MSQTRHWRRPLLGGPRLTVHPVFLLLLVIAIAAGFGREALALCLVLAGHELAHLLAATAFRLRTVSIEILPFGGVMRLEGLDLADPGVEAAVALAGPLHNLLWLCAGFSLRELGWLQPDVGSFFLVANAVVGAGNLLPALPLDGGRVAQAMLSAYRGHRAAGVLLGRCGYALAILLALGGAVLLWRGVFAPSLFIFGAFVGLRAGPERKMGLTRPWRELTGRAGLLAREGMFPVRPLAVPPSLPLRELVQQFVPRAYHVVWVVHGSGASSGPWDEAEIWQTLRRRGAGAIALDLRRAAGIGGDDVRRP